MTVPNVIIGTGAACMDCVQYLANGEVTNGNGDDVTEAHAALVKYSDGEVTLGGCPDCGPEDVCEPWFSWSPCDVCGSHLGGSREYVTFWES